MPGDASLSDTHPCLSCGACCSAYRVAMYWSEVDERGIDPALTRKLDPLRVEMRVDNNTDLRCIALRGTVGDAAHCSIYSERPSPCRDLQASWEDGAPSPQCDRARARHGLPPLTPENWPAPELDR